MEGKRGEELLSCFICFARAESPQLCPYCSGLYCATCILRWLTENRSSCPHCRSPLTERSLVNGRLITQLAQLLDLKEDLCPLHDKEIDYFCSNCEVGVCAECALFDDRHKGHNFMRNTDIYTEKSSQLLAFRDILTTRMTELHLQNDEIQRKIDDLKRSKENLAAKIELKAEQFLLELENSLSNKAEICCDQRNSLIRLGNLWENSQKSAEKLLTESTKAHLIANSSEILSILRDNLSFPIPTPTLTSPSFEIPLKPPFLTSIFIIHDYSSVKLQSEVIYSHSLPAYNSHFRLKVFPNGNGTSKNSFLSVFLELLDHGLSGKYDYLVELVNNLDPKLHLVREFTSDFNPGECWGYNRFILLEKLTEEGYLEENEDRLVLKFAVRPCSYRQICGNQREIIEKLERNRREKTEVERENDGMEGNKGDWIEKRFKGLMESLGDG